jgi:putative tricarboxylic transport membrane protein
MDFLNAISSGFITAFQPVNLLYCFVGVLVGTLIGVLPGIGPAGTIAILMPMTFNMSAVSAIIMLAGIYYGAMYGGSTTSILVNMPGEAASVVTCIDGYQMALKGRAGPALGISAIGSFVAGIIGVILLAFLAPLFAEVALSFGYPEYFSLMVLGMTLVIYLGSGSIIKALMMAVVGFIFACVGQDPIAGVPRLTYGIDFLWDGLDIIPIIMGLFGISEILMNLGKEEKLEIFKTRIKGLLPNRDDWRKSAIPILRGSILGFFIGILPGSSATLATFTSYGIEKKFSKHPDDFGKGAIEGVAGPESANNAATMGFMVPLLTLGIPVNPVLGMFLAALLIHGTPPGPFLIKNHPDLFWGVIVSMILGNLMLLILNLPLIGIWIRVLKVPYKILFPLILLFCLIGSYSCNFRVTDMLIMLGAGYLGYLMRRFDYEAPPLVLALILGPLMETNLRQSLIMSKGDLTLFFVRPISLMCLLVAFFFLIFPLLSHVLKQQRKKRAY